MHVYVAENKQAKAYTTDIRDNTYLKLQWQMTSVQVYLSLKVYNGIMKKDSNVLFK